MSGSGMIASARPMRLATNAECAAYLRAKASAIQNMRRLSASEKSTMSRAFKAAAEEVEQGFHLEGED